MRNNRPTFDRYEIKAIITGRKMVSLPVMKKMLASCLERIAELEATVEDFMQDAIDAELETAIEYAEKPE